MHGVRPITDLVPEAYIALLLLLLLALAYAALADSSTEAKYLITEAFWILWVSPFLLLQLWMSWSQIRPYSGRHRTR